MVTTRISSAFAFIGDGDVGDTRAPGYILFRQFISEAVGAQTISGTVSGVVRGQEQHASQAARLAVRVAKCDSAGSGVTELLTYTASNSESVPPAMVQTPTAYTNRRFEEIATPDDFALSLASTGVSAGDFLIVEIGVREDLQYTSTRYSKLEFGDNSASDLAANETGTTQDNPWVEFSMDIAFGGGAFLAKGQKPIGQAVKRASEW